MLRGLSAFFQDYDNELKSLKISKYLNSLDKQMNKEFYKEHPALESFAKHHGSSSLKSGSHICLRTDGL